MKKLFRKTTWMLIAFMSIMSSCDKQEPIEQSPQKPQDGDIAVGTEIIVDGENVTNTRAASEAGYTTGDGLYDKGVEVTVDAFANDGYELTAFYDKQYPDVNLGSSHTFPARIPQTFKAEFKKKPRFIVAGKNSYIGFPDKLEQIGSTDNKWYSITYGNGIFVAVGGNEYSYSKACTAISSDGINWNITSSTTMARWWDDVIYADGKFVAVGSSSGLARVSSSVDGINWTTPKELSMVSAEAIVYGNGKFVIAGGSGAISSSVDGTNWTTHFRIPANGNLDDLAFENGVFVATGKTEISSSVDGINWTTKALGRGEMLWKGVTYGNGKFVAVGWYNQKGYASTSVDGFNWTEPEQVRNRLFSVTYSNGEFIAVGAGYYSETGFITSSTDGINWKESKGTPHSLSAVCAVP